MVAHSLVLSVPAGLYNRLEARAAKARRSLEEETLTLLTTATPADDPLPTDLAGDVAAVALLDDADLWRAADNRLPEEAAGRLEALHLKRQRDGLTSDEDQARAALVRQYERAMLVRAEAVAQLHRRGHVVKPASPRS